MRNFAYVNPDFEHDDVTPELVEGNPCYEPSVYDSVMLEELSDGSYMYMDMTSILLNQEKYRRLLGDMNVQNILAQMHPTQSTVMDGMTDEESPAKTILIRWLLSLALKLLNTWVIMRIILVVGLM
jgi:hypothetical protein